jgi:hypothetical protein
VAKTAPPCGLNFRNSRNFRYPFAHVPAAPRPVAEVCEVSEVSEVVFEGVSEVSEVSEVSLRGGG